MAAASPRLRVNVQADRLPNVGGGSKAQIGLRLSAAIENADALPAVDRLVHELLPWKWRRDGGGPWNPHDPAAWQVWRIDAAGTVTEIDPATIEAAVAAPAGFDGSGRFIARLDADIDSIVAGIGPEAAMGWPGDGSEVSGRTVFGAVESLTGLPHPVPAATKVFTALTISALPDEHDRFIAAPVFKPAHQGGYAAPAGPVIERDADGLTFAISELTADPADLPLFAHARVVMRPSLSWSTIARKDDQQLIDLAQMLIARPSGGHGESSIEDDDWAATLARRVADAVNPWARVLSVLDQTIAESIDPARPHGAALRAALAADLAQAQPRFLRALDAMAWAVAGPRAAASAMTSPPSGLMLDALASRHPDSWSDALGHGLAHAQRAAAGLPGRDYFAAVPARRIAGAIGLPANPAGPEPVDAREAAAIDSDQGLLGFVARHWLGGLGTDDRVTVLAGTSLDLANRWRLARPDAPAIGAGAPAPAAAPLIDLQRIVTFAPRARDVAFNVLLEIPAADFSLDIAFNRAAATAAANVTVAAKAADATIAVTVAQGSQSATVQVPRQSEVTLTIAFAIAAEPPVAVTLSAGVAGTMASVPATAALLAAPFYLTLATTGSAIALAIPAADLTQTALRAAFERSATAPGLRIDLGLAFVGPFFPGLMAGRLTWSAAQPPSEIDDAAKKPLARRLSESIAALVGDAGSDADPARVSLYGELRANAIAAAQLDPSNPDQLRLIELLTEAIDNARRDAAARAGTLIPAAGSDKDVGRRLTMTAPPVTFRIDQLQSFAGAEDLWSRLAGASVLLSRTPTYDDDPADWWTLNVATLHIPATEANGRAPLTRDNAVAVTTAAWPHGAIVDPVPMQVGETDGVRSAIMSYDNRSPVAEMASDTALDQPAGATFAVARRIEAYAFPPPSSAYLLPSLSFGYAYHVLPYLIGQGGVLPPILRAREDDPVTRRSAVTAADGSKRIKLDADPADFRRKALYRRTRPVGAPRLAGDKRLRTVPDGVPPLALELSIRPTPVTLSPKVDGRYFLDKEGRSGVLDVRPPSGDDRPGLRIEIGGIRWGAAGAGTLTITFVGRDAAGDAVERSDTLPGVAAGRVRIDLFGDAVTREDSAEQQESTEDAFRFGAPVPLGPALQDVATWRNVALSIGADKEVEIEPPVVTAIARVRQHDGGWRTQIVGKPRLPPESSHQARTVVMIDGIQDNLVTEWRTLDIDVKRPSIEFGSYERWINPPLFEPPLAGARAAVVAALDQAHKTATQVKEPKGDRSLEDPAVTALFAELVRIFPQREAFPMTRLGDAWSSLEDVLGFDAGRRRETSRRITVRETKGNEGLKGSAASVRPGHIYELRIYAGIPQAQPDICKFTREQRLSPSVRASLRRCPVDAAMQLAPPLVLTIEVATSEMPNHLAPDSPVQRRAIGATEPRPLDILQVRPPLAPEDQALVRLSDDVVRAPESYPSLRYCHLASLIAQRWSWRGRPQDDLWPAFGGTVRDKGFGPFFDIAFSDRRDDDVGEVVERRIERAHAYGGRERRDDPQAGSPCPTLFEHPLQWRGGVNLWRFALRLTSRYAAMRPGKAAFAVNSHVRGSGPARWQNEIVLDRSIGRQLKRPGLALVLPLTEPMMAAGAVPPLLALFNERLYPNFHIGDGIEVTIETARHPFPLKQRLTHDMHQVEAAIAALPSPPLNEDQETEQQRLVERRNEFIRELGAIADHTPPALKFWQERGPDPIRTGAGADGTILPLRLDGPIGYTFDLKTEAGRFDHAGLLVTPVKQELSPWSLVKLRFRRHEAPEGLDPTMELTADGPAPGRGGKPSQHQFLAAGAAVHYRLANHRALMAKPSVARVFPTEHEGIVIDIPKVAALTPDSAIRISFVGEIKQPAPATPPDQHHVEIGCAYQRAEGRLELAFRTDLGDAGAWSISVRDGATASIRLVLSARDKPETGGKYEPAGDVAVRVRLTRSEPADTLGKAGENRWLAVGCIPLISTRVIAVDDPVVVEIRSDLPAQAGALVAPVRLSTFTPGLWCQFAEAMSLFQATFADGTERTIATGELKAKIRNAVVEIGASHGTLRSLAAIPQPGAEADGSQVEELLVVVVTRYMRDVFDQVRERPVAIKLWDPAALSLDLARPDWPRLQKDKDDKDIPLGADDFGAHGRVRFLKILRAKTRLRGGILDEEAVFPDDFFGAEMLEEVADINPPDAKGLVLGTSMPIEWESKP